MANADDARELSRILDELISNPGTSISVTEFRMICRHHPYAENKILSRYTIQYLNLLIYSISGFDFSIDDSNQYRFQLIGNLLRYYTIYNFDPALLSDSIKNYQLLK